MAGLSRRYNVGPDWTVLGVQAVSVSSSDGTYTLGSYTSILGTVHEHEEEGVRDVEQIVPASSGRRNPVPLSTGTRYTLTEFMTNNAGSGSGNRESVLRAIDLGSNYVAVQFQAQTGGMTMTLIGLITGSRGKRVRGGNTFTLTLESVDIGASNQAFA